MNRFLVDLLADLNVVLAIAILLFGAAAGYYWAKGTGDNLTFGMGIGIGLVAGLIVAAIVCGLLACLILIERHLRLIADDVEEMRRPETR